MIKPIICIDLTDKQTDKQKDQEIDRSRNMANF